MSKEAKEKKAAAAAEEKLKAAYAMDEATRVDELAKALLREYMHRKGYKKTLAKFDEENPRDPARTISSRIVMNETMALGVLSERNKVAGEKGTHEPFATIMELLCSYRLRKHNLKKDGASASTRVSTSDGPLPQRDDHDRYDSSDEEELATKAVADRKQRLEIRQKEFELEKGKVDLQIAELKEKAAAMAAAASSAKKEKKPKKDKKDKKEKGGDEKSEKKKKDKKDKKDKKSKGGEEDPFSSSGTKKPGVGKSFDPLAAASQDSLVSAGISSGSNALGGKGKGWTPGGLGAVPDVGLGAASGGASSALGDMPPPSFIAGDGMSLAGGEAGARKEPAKEWEAPTTNKNKQSHSGPPTKAAFGFDPISSSSSSGAGLSNDDSGFIDNTYSSISVSPDHFKKQYNPKATAQGVVKKASPNTDTPGVSFAGFGAGSGGAAKPARSPTGLGGGNTQSPERRNSGGSLKEGISPFRKNSFGEGGSVEGELTRKRSDRRVKIMME